MFGETRWTVRASLLTCISENYEEQEELWDWCLGEYREREAKVRIHGVQSQMQTFKYFFGLSLAIFLPRHSNNLSTTLQAKDLCAAKDQKISKKTVETQKKDEMRNLSSFGKTYKARQPICVPILQSY